MNTGWPAINLLSVIAGKIGRRAAPRCARRHV